MIAAFEQGKRRRNDRKSFQRRRSAPPRHALQRRHFVDQNPMRRGIRHQSGIGVSSRFAGEAGGTLNNLRWNLQPDDSSSNNVSRHVPPTQNRTIFQCLLIPLPFPSWA